MSEPLGRPFLVRLFWAITSAAVVIGKGTLEFALGVLGAMITIPLMFILGIIMGILTLMGIVDERGPYHRPDPKKPNVGDEKSPKA